MFKNRVVAVIKGLGVAVVVLVIGSIATAAQQKRHIYIHTELEQASCTPQAVNYYDRTEVFIDDVQQDPAGWMAGRPAVDAGAHKLTVKTPADPGHKMIIKEIKYTDGSNVQTFTPNTPEATVSITAQAVLVPNPTAAELQITAGCGGKAPRLPIIFLPGVAGTILNVMNLGNLTSDHDELWPTATFASRTSLGLDTDGKTPALAGPSVVTSDILRRSGMNFYGGMMDFIKAKGFKEDDGFFVASEIVNLFAFPYDWRFDNAVHFTELDLLIKQALKQSPDAKKVILLAHSMGGYIARSYILSSSERASKVDALITMGTPYWGAPKPYYGVVSGYTFGNPTIRQELMKVLLQNMPAAYQLMPNYPFIVDSIKNRILTPEESAQIRYKAEIIIKEYAGAPVKDQYDETPDNRWFFNPGLVKLAQELNKPLGTKERPAPLPGGVQNYAIIGTGVKTLALFYLRDAGPKERFVELAGRKVVLEPFFSDGDGTVPLQGSELSTATATYYIPYFKNASSAHGDLPANPTVQQIVGQIIDGNPPDANQYRYSMAQKGLKDVEEGADFTLHSDAHLSIVDAGTGKLLGFNNQGGINEDLPSGSFLSIEGVEYAAIADINTPLKVLVAGLRDGKFTLDVNVKRAGKTVAHFSYREVPVRKGTVAQVNLTPGQVTSPPPLSITTDGRTANIPATSGTMPASAVPSGAPLGGGTGATAGALGAGSVPGPGPATGPPSIASPPAMDLTGLWLDNGGRAVYRVRQLGNRVYWSVDAGTGGSINVYVGDISGNTINGVWVDLPQSATHNTGQLSLRIDSNDHLSKVGENPCCYGAQEWRRQGTTAGLPQGAVPRAAPAPPAGASAGGISMELNTDRSGQDYRNFDLQQPRPELCQAQCAGDANCKAYTYVKPGVQGPNARCWLKSAVPPPQGNSCCVSGVKGSK